MNNLKIKFFFLKISLTVTILLLLLSSFVLAEGVNYEQYNDYDISSVVIEGLTNNSASNNFSDELFTKSQTVFNSAMLKSDLSHIFSLGVFEDVQVDIKKTDDNHIQVIFRVVPNPIVKKLDIDGSTIYSKKELMAGMLMKVGEVLDNNNLRQDSNFLLKHYYEDKGYVLARLVNVEKPSISNNYTLSYYLEEGVIDKIVIEGNDTTKEYVLLREMTLKAGSIFNKETLGADLRSIYNLSYFESIEPDYQVSPLDRSKIILVIEVSEKSANSFNFGGGWSGAQGGFGFADLNFGNLYGTGQQAVAKMQIGESSTYQLKYYNPWMWEDRTSLTAKYWLKEGRSLGIEGVDSSSASNELRNGFSVAIGKRLFPNITGLVTFLNEDVSPSDDVKYNIRSLDYAIIYDTRDYFLDPRSGERIIVGMEDASRILQGTVIYTKWRVQLEKFYKLAENQVLASRISWGKQEGEVMSTEEYWMGGSDSVRGFRSGDYFSRGREKLLYNLEYRYRFNEVLQSVVFYDLGNAWDTSSDFANSNNFRSSYGFGMRLQVPMLGPMRLDYGVADDKEFGQGVLHFSIGQVF